MIALSQLLGGWTKWGWPQVSGKVFLVGFLPTLIAGGWILAAQEPGGLLARQARSELVRTTSGSRPRQRPRADDSGRRVRDRARLRSHVRHDRPEERLKTKGVPAAGAQRPVAATANGQERPRGSSRPPGGRTRRPGEQAAPRTREPAKKYVRKCRRRLGARVLTPGRDDAAGARADIRRMTAASPQTRGLTLILEHCSGLTRRTRPAPLPSPASGWRSATSSPGCYSARWRATTAAACCAED